MKSNITLNSKAQNQSTDYYKNKPPPLPETFKNVLKNFQEANIDIV